MDSVYNIETLVKRYPQLEVCKNSIEEAYNILCECFSTGHKLLIAGNGGSCADADHIVGELMKGFKKKRPVEDDFSKLLSSINEPLGSELGEKLQKGLPAIALHNHQGLNTAFINDVPNGGLLMYAQQILTYGEEGDVFLAISTSGNSKNIAYANVVAKAKGVKIIGLTGQNGGLLNDIADVIIKAPSNETFMIQEYHLPIYHCLCLMLEERFFQQ